MCVCVCVCACVCVCVCAYVCVSVVLSAYPVWFVGHLILFGDYWFLCSCLEPWLLFCLFVSLSLLASKRLEHVKNCIGGWERVWWGYCLEVNQAKYRSNTKTFRIHVI